jgi:hypothetical protein
MVGKPSMMKLDYLWSADRDGLLGQIYYRTCGSMECGPLRRAVAVLVTLSAATTILSSLTVLPAISALIVVFLATGDWGRAATAARHGALFWAAIAAIGVVFGTCFLSLILVIRLLIRLGLVTHPADDGKGDSV